jgi:ABC-type antimicrobial peptide transport system permease subunit
MVTALEELLNVGVEIAKNSVTMGIPKKSILVQYLIEGTLVALFAILLMVLPAKALGSTLDRELMSYAVEESGQQEMLNVSQNASYANIIDFFAEYRNVTPDSVSAGLSVGTIALGAALMLVVTWLSILIANARALLMPPKKVLALSK